MLEYEKISWWFWLFTVILLSIGVAGFPDAFLWAIGFTIFQLAYYGLKLKSMSAFPVQVRFWYLALLVISLPVDLQWLYWLPTVGAWVQVLVGYCLLARCVLMLPWNSEEPFSYGGFKRVIFSKPVRGSVK